MSVGVSLKSNNLAVHPHDKSSTNITKNMEEEKHGSAVNNNHLFFAQQSSYSQKSSFNKPYNQPNSVSYKVNEPDIERAIKKWQDGGNLNNNNHLD